MVALLFLLLTLVFSALGMAVWVATVGSWWMGVQLRRRLMWRLAASGPALQLRPPSVWRQHSQRVAHALSRWTPADPAQPGVPLKFVRAGWRSAQAPQWFLLSKLVLGLGLGLGLFLALPQLLPRVQALHGLLAALTVWFVANAVPDLVLHLRTQERLDRMKEGLPDMIDLLVICTESGLGMDAAVTKVARETLRSCPELAEELHLMGLGVRAGEARLEAMRHLAERVNLDDLRALVSMWAQADRFGTSLADALRIHADTMRTQRLQRAEEMAAKIPTKMLLPLVGLIFPVLLMVLLGPAIIQIGKAFA